MRLGGSPPLVSKETMFNISSQSDEEIQSYWPPSAGSECGHYWESRYMVLYWTIEFLINIWVTFVLPFTSMHVYKPHISTPWSSFGPFFLWRVQEEFMCESTTHFCEEKRIKHHFGQVFILKPKFSSEKLFHV